MRGRPHPAFRCRSRSHPAVAWRDLSTGFRRRRSAHNRRPEIPERPGQELPGLVVVVDNEDPDPAAFHASCQRTRATPGPVHLAPHVAIKCRGLRESKRAVAVEAALTKYVP